MKTLTMLCCSAIAMCGSMFAQSMPDHMTVQLKNPMMVGETRLPAGKCDIQVIRGGSDSTILVLRMENGPSVAAMVNRMQVADSDPAELVLNRHGNNLQLSRVMFGESVGYQLAGVE